MSKLECNVCHHHCKLSENQIGLCKARSNIDGKIAPVNYGEITSIALDPIEKKPLNRFYPGSKILSVGSYGCNLKCSFCQNYEISTVGKGELRTQHATPENLIQIALDLIPCGNIGIAYTYNEPLVGYEFVRDCAVLAKKNKLKNVVVTNGCFNEEVLNELAPYIDAFNIDLKGFSDKFYKNIGGDFELVKNFIINAHKNAHIELTTLIIPDENDSQEEIIELSGFIASIDNEIPLHISRFFPNYKMNKKSPTEVKKVYELANIARRKLKYVYEGNC
jgi:pyruvate formate lyase activating enzyme